MLADESLTNLKTLF